MDKLINDKCDLYGISPDVLTERERSLLIEEIKAEQQGKRVLDSVLDNPELHYRDLL